jgi:hypothetical protein
VSEWTKQRLEQMIADGVEESLSLDYKRADALAKTDRKREEIVKDVSAFANSSGGVLIYGIAEFTDAARKYLPERLDPVSRTEFSKEGLDQVIQSIQPRIDGIVIHPVTISEQDNTVCYVVEVPQSHTAHMARDHRYHKRHNFTTQAMEDYEVRDVMQRRKYPRIEVQFRVNHVKRKISNDDGVIMVRIQNSGSVLIHHFMVELEIPVYLNHPIFIEAAIMDRDQDGDYFFTRLMPTVLGTPVFPGSSHTLNLKYRTRIQPLDPRPPLKSRDYIKIRVFADEMPPLHGRLEIAPVLAGWTPVVPGNSHK